ncbi:VOC family protein [Mumia zhuanghuii]|uniref:VOC family protein n=2 Tax=Mumia TaxID=1546255 RepID=A0ABW1QRV8_9ACTN|nr:MULTISPECIES: VOC family protein [Mumia]KAA1425088.1 VOC family protein [Mumia zhuanghuii]
MLDGTAYTAMVPVRDVARARRFYEDTLGLKGKGDTIDGGYAFETADGHALALLPDPDGEPTGRTTISFEVPDVAAEVVALAEAGVAFADYDTPELKTENHIATFDGEQAAWFADTEGNVLCIHAVTG